jgi:hypothetical protein
MRGNAEDVTIEAKGLADVLDGDADVGNARGVRHGHSGVAGWKQSQS